MWVAAAAGPMTSAGAGQQSLLTLVCHKSRVTDGSDNVETEVLFDRRKVAVVVEQRMAMLDAEGADDDVSGLTNRNAQFSQFAIVAGGAWGEIGTQHRDERVTTQTALDARGMRFVPGALQDFEQDQITDQQRHPHGQGSQLGSRRRSLAAQMGNPDGAIDENHGRSGEQP